LAKFDHQQHHILLEKWEEEISIITPTCQTDAHIYLVLEYCQQGNLYEAIRIGHGPQLETEHVRRFMLELVDARLLHSLEGRLPSGTSNRKTSSSPSRGSVKLGDFGLTTDAPSSGPDTY
ncbi:hypothetical protein OQA88_1040, partial [Cercophora sp. LCS_1]